MGLLQRLAAALALRSVGAIASHFVMGLTFAILWVSPYTFGAEVPGELGLLLMFEFVVLHSTGMILGFRAMAGFPTWIFLILYLPFGLIIGSQLSSPLVLIFFLWHMAAMIWGDLDMGERMIGGFLVRYVPTFIWFVACPFIAVVFGLPALGWEGGPSSWAFRTDQGFSSYALTPAWGTLYFTGRSVWEFLVRRWERSGALAEFITKVQKT